MDGPLIPPTALMAFLVFGNYYFTTNAWAVDYHAPALISSAAILSKQWQPTG